MSGAEATRKLVSCAREVRQKRSIGIAAALLKAAPGPCDLTEWLLTRRFLEALALERIGDWNPACWRPDMLGCPEGRLLRHTGRDKGDLVIRLVSRDEAAPRPEPLPPIGVPDTLDGCHDAVRALRDTPGLLGVSDGSRGRALLIAQAIAAECVLRGYTFAVDPDGEPGFQIVVGDVVFVFTLSEEYERGEVVDSQKLASAKYDWQRVPSTLQQVPSGRLLLQMRTGYRVVSWADRKRWSLDQKLPAVFKDITDRARAQVEAREREQAERHRRRQAWEDAVPRARQAYVDHLNRERLGRQAARSVEAVSLRAYCGRLEAAANACLDPGQAERIRGWARWALGEADRIDPMHDIDALRYLVPETINPSDFQDFMPRGMNAHWPPD